MLEYDIIENKALTTINGVKCFDLLSDSFNKSKELEGSVIIVNKYYVARPDLISLAVYGDDKYGDIICKVNGISNPFELNENMVLKIPSIEYIIDCKTANSGKCELIDDEDTTISTTSNTTYKKAKNASRSSNELTINDQNYIIDKSMGIVFY